MASLIATKSPVRPVRRSASRKMTVSSIRQRLEQIELATVSSLRALQMDVDGDHGVPSAAVLKRARTAVR